MDFGFFLDVGVLVVLLGSVLISLFRGFIREMLTIFGIVGGILAAYMFGPLLEPMMRGWMDVTPANEAEEFFGPVSNAMAATGFAYGAVLIVFAIIFSVIGHFISKGVRSLGLGALDRTLGVVFGVARGVLVLSIMYLLPYHILGDEEKEEYFANSKTLPYLETSTAWVKGFMPEAANEKMEEADEKIGEASEMRKKLENIGVLGNGDSEKDEPQELRDTPQKEGYSDDFRDKMDALIEQNTDTSPAYNE